MSETLVVRKGVEDIIKELLREGFCSIIGPNWIGKTTFIHQIKDRIEKEFPKYSVIYIDLTKFKGLAFRSVCTKLSKNITAGCGIIDSKTYKAVSEESFRLFLIEVLNARPDTRLILVLDGMECLDKDSMRRIFSLFRAISNERYSSGFFRLSVLLVGAVTLSQLSGPDEESYRIGGYVLSDLTKEEARALIDKLAKERGVLVRNDVKRYLIKETGGHPFLLKILWDSCKKEKKEVTKHNLQKAIDKIVAEGSEDMKEMKRKVEEYPEALEILAEISDKKRIKRKEAITGTRDVGRLELTGGFVFKKESYMFRNPIYERFLKKEFGWKRLGELFVQIRKPMFAFMCYKKWIKDLKDTPFSQKASEISEFIVPLINAFSEPEDVYNIIFEVFHGLLGFNEVRIFILNSKNNTLECKKNIKKEGDIPLLRDSPTIESKVLFFKKEYSIDHKTKRLVIPLLGQEKKRIGILTLKPSPLEKTEISTLTALINRLSIAMSEIIRIKKTEEELKDIHLKLSQQVRLAILGETLLTLVHEIRQPLTHIQAASYLLSKLIEKKIGEDKDIKKHFNMIGGNIERLGRLIESLIQHGKPALSEIKPVDINKIIKNTILFTKYSLQNVKVVKRFTPRLPLLEADGDQLKQVFLNIISNAVEAMPEGGTLTITTKFEEGQVIITFQDTGHGIPKKDINKVFEPFFTTKKKEGVGLGMAISRRIIETHDGKIDVESEVEKGTIFTIKLPSIGK
ncbi:TPA: hypothetical protein DCX16_06575 [bacterium]|nr:hypothetical protein [bacterium]